MISKLETPNEILGMDISGKLEKKDYQKIQSLFDAQLEKVNELKVLIIYNKFEGLTLEAMKEDLKTFFKYDIDKMAFVSEMGWLRRIVDSPISLLIPKKTEMKSFKPTEKKTALVWLTE